MAWKSCCGLLLWLPLLFAQGSGHLSLGKLHSVAAKRGEAVEARIPVTVDAGFHVNSNKPSEDYLIPLTLTWVATGALQAGEIDYPKPSMEKYAFTDKPLSVLTGSFELVAHFKVAGNAPAGPGAAAGKLRYQACNSNTCFPPKTIDVNLPYAVE